MKRNLKSLGLNAKEGNKTKVFLNKYGTIQFESRKKANIFKKFHSELVVKKIQIALNKFNSSIPKDYYNGISNNKGNEFCLI